MGAHHATHPPDRRGGEPRVDPEQRVKLAAVGAGITRVLLYFGFMETPNVMEGLALACREAALNGIDSA